MIRQEAKEVISHARRAGLQIELLTGDSPSQGARLAHSVGIGAVFTGHTPQQKMTHVQDLQHHGAVVTMVGDGLNDAPVLGTANASFVVAGQTDLARSQSDNVIVDHDMHKVIQTL